MLAVIGGHNGKTRIASELIRALPDANWSALKISGGLLGSAALAGIHEEQVANSRTDSGRMLAAGACRSYEVGSPKGDLSETLPELERLIRAAGNAIIETNSLLRVVEADLCLFLLDVTAGNWSEVSAEVASQVDAFIAIDRGEDEGTPSEVAGRPVFRVAATGALSEELIELVHSKLRS